MLTCTRARAPYPYQDVSQGASTSVYACLADGIPAGSYLSDCDVAKPNKACEGMPHRVGTQG